MASGGTFGAYVVMDPVKLADVLRGSDGPVVRRLIEDGEAVKQEAQRRVGVHRPQPGERRTRRPGTLRDSIVKRIVQDGGEAAVLVGSEDPIALLHHEGTLPHTIYPRSASRLVFYWPKVGRVVAFPRVNHPGTEPNKYLEDALAILRTRY